MDDLLKDWGDILKGCSEVVPLKNGGQKKVIKCRHPKYGEVVIKTCKFSSDPSPERTKREINFMKTVNSKFFPRNFESHIDESSNKFLIIEEFIDCIPFEEVKRYYNEEKKLIELLKVLIEALNTLWNNNIVHRDLKPENILFRKDFTPVIIDLGIARFLDAESLTRTMDLSGPCTPDYASPEQLLNRKELIGIRTDIFLLGIFMLELYLGFHPFSPDKVVNNKTIPDNIVSGTYVRASTRPGTSEKFCILIDKMLKIYPYERFRNAEILNKYLEDNWREL